jgi:DNA processing protein
MDLQTAVAGSLLPTFKARAAAAFKANRHRSDSEVLTAVLAACGSRSLGFGGVVEDARRNAANLIEKGLAAGIEPIAWFDPRYPALLECTNDPPPVLWVKGDSALAGRPCVAIVGSRAATKYALDVAERLAAELAEARVIVASGLARGVDSAAHRGCLAAGGPTIAVLGSGVDRIYPAEHAALAADICKNGALLSELGPGAPPLQEHFPLRNRIISGISLAVVIVEASEKSGSLITARCALEQGRDVMAVPGNVLTGRNRGSHALLKDGAKVVESAVDILDELNWPGAGRAYSGAKSLESDPLLARMEPGEVYRLDDLIAVSGISGQKLLPRLMELELLGRVNRSGDGGFARVGPKTGNPAGGLLT